MPPTMLHHISFLKLDFGLQLKWVAKKYEKKIGEIGILDSDMLFLNRMPVRDHLINMALG